MQGNTTTFVKNCKNFIPAVSSFFSGARQNYKVWKKIQDRIWLYAPECRREQLECYERSYLKRHHDQSKNMWVDKELSTEVTQKEIAELIHYKQDLWRVIHGGLSFFLIGFYSIPFYMIWLGTDTWLPRGFAITEEQKKQYRLAQDLYRYKWAPSYLTETRWFFDSNAMPWTPKYERGWEELWEKNDTRRDPIVCRDAAPMYDKFIIFRDMKRLTGRFLGRSMGIPTFPLWAKMCIGTRIRDYWELVWNEDYMVITQKLHEKMSDEDLYDYAWRRFLAPYDKNLSHEEVMRRVEDYHHFLGPDFIEKGEAPNIFITTSYCLGYYNDPAYLVGDIKELDGNDYENLSSWPKDAFLRRLEFENGPLRDQVEAHSQAVLARQKEARETYQEQKRLDKEERQAYLKRLARGGKGSGRKGGEDVEGEERGEKRREARKDEGEKAAEI